MDSKRRGVSIRRVLWVVPAVILAFVALDYVSYHSRNRSAMAVVSDLDGRALSLGGWPFGKEINITFARPLSDSELERLSVLNSLASRDGLYIIFNCDLSPEQLATAQRVLSECHVYHLEARFRKR